MNKEDLHQDELKRLVRSTTINEVILENEKLSKCKIRYLKIDSVYDPNVLLGAVKTIKSGRVKSFLLPFLHTKLSDDPSDLYALDRQSKNCYGPILEEDFDKFHENHVIRHFQTDLLVLIDNDLKTMFRANKVYSSWNINVNA
jgi:hypothetical protein